MSAPPLSGASESAPPLTASVAEPLVVGERLGIRFGERLVFPRLDFRLERGGFMLLTGPNGAGKTSLLRLLAGLAAPSEGELRVGLQRERIGYVGHEPLVYRELTPAENLRLFERLYGVPSQRSQALLERFGLQAVADKRVSSFSRGMKQRLALCRALLHEPELLLLDEPFDGLDSESAALLEHELSSSPPARTVVVATHDPERLRALATLRLELP